MTLTRLLKRAEQQIERVEKTRGKLPAMPEFVPHAAQKKVLDSAERFNVLGCGRRFGKSVLGVHLLAKTALKGLPVAYAVPTYRQSSDRWREFLYYLAPAISAKNATERRITLFTGGSVDVWSLDRFDSIRGKKYALFVVDEAAFARRLIEAFNLVIRPTLSDYRGGAWFMSSPNGFNEFYELFQRGQMRDYPLWQSWQMPTSANPMIDPLEIESARQDMPARQFQQEYEAAFLPSLSSGMFRREWFRIIETRPNSAEIEQTVRAWDLAASVNGDYTVGVLLARLRGEHTPFVILDVIRGRWTPHERDEQIRRTAERDGRETAIIIEEEGGSAGVHQSAALTKMLSGFIVQSVRPTGDKVTRAMPFASQAEAGNIRLLRADWNINYLNELESFPEGMNDDQVDASAYAVNGLDELKNRRVYVGIGWGKS